VGVLHPETKLKLDRGLAKCHDKRVGRRHGEEALGVARRLSHQSKSLVEIGIVWNPDRLAGG
jgi:hypothetical protein